LSSGIAPEPRFEWNYRNKPSLKTSIAQSKVSKTDLLWLLPLIKDPVGSRTKESFELAWKELNRVAQSTDEDNLLDWLGSTYHEISV